MARLRIRLFGKLSVAVGDVDGEQAITTIDPGKTQELLCYLLIHRDRTHDRESLAGALWAETSTAQSRKALRQALWQLQSGLTAGLPADVARLLLVEADGVGINPAADPWLDVAEFEQVFARIRPIRGQALDAESIGLLRDASRLYSGDLLEGASQEWCVIERVRLQAMHLTMLEKDMIYSEAHAQYDEGLASGDRILRYDRAHERTHRRLMRMHYLAGDRTEALRQYERCAAALDEELGVKPARGTILLHEQIRADRLARPGEQPAAPGHGAGAIPPADAAALTDLLQRLKQLRSTVAGLQRQVRQDIETVERYLGSSE